jgi:NADH-quinone oxidoreductase subunit H
MIGMLITAVISVTLIMVLLVIAGTFTWVERRLLGFVQERYGPNRVGPFGSLQWVADTVKILTKEDRPPPGADKFIYILAPAVAATPVLIGFGVVAIGDGVALAPVDVGVLFLLGMMGLTAYAAMLGAWASHNRFSLMGGMRAAAQMLAYEVFLGLSLMGVVMIAEYTGMSFGLFFLGEYLAVLLVSALAVTLFFGGWLGPWLPGPVWFGIKTGVIAVVFVWLRATLPRPRYDQLLGFAWKIALPLSLLNLLATGIVVVARSAS